MNHSSQMQPIDKQAVRPVSDEERAHVGAPTKFPVRFAVIAGLGLIALCTMIVEVVAR